MPWPFEIRGATTADEDQLLDVARHLNTVNLPADRDEIRGILELAQRSFSGAVKDPRRREYVFVLVDHERDRIVGTSMIVGQLGRRDAPYIYVDVFEEERYSATLDKHFRHVVLKIGYSYNGPTEIGGLIVSPEYRKKPERLGLMISYVRFLFIKMHREWFRDELLAELLPPLEPDGTSHLWDALGRKFTDMTYADADRLSKKNKEFVKGLFPEGAIYASLLPQQAQEVIGKVGGQTRGVERMLRRIGFRYAERVDPFDGGPHFTAPTDEVTLVRRVHPARVTRLLASAETPRTRALLAIETDAPPFFRCVCAPWRMAAGEPGPRDANGEGAAGTEGLERAGAEIANTSADHLRVGVGDNVWVLPVEQKGGAVAISPDGPPSDAGA
jgi:arginine N-succinyltransferase